MCTPGCTGHEAWDPINQQISHLIEIRSSNIIGKSWQHFYGNITIDKMIDGNKIIVNFPNRGTANYPS